METQTKTTHNNNNTNFNKNHIKDWTKYNQGLVNRGNFTFMINQAVLAPVEQTGKAGHPKEYSDTLILVLACIREFTGLPFRQLIGHAVMLVGLFGIKLPSYSTLCKRMQKLHVPSNISQSRLSDNGVCLLIDSTGLKVSGEGEWKVKKHGAGKRRTWTKLHISVDFASEQILSYVTTPDNIVDGIVAPDLLDRVARDTKIEQLLGDGAYNSHKLYTEIEKERKISLLSPPRKNAKLHVKFTTTHPGRGGSGGKYADFIDEVGWETQNQYLRECIHLGWDGWKDKTGYHKCSLVETTMWRLKSAFSGRLKSKCLLNQQTEIAIRVSLLNMWTNRAMPTYT